MIAGLAEGRVVRYVLAPEDIDQVLTAKNPVPEGRSVVALIVKVVDAETGVVNLTLFPDWSNDGFVFRGSAIPQPLGIAWRQNVAYSEDRAPGCWHWPTRPQIAPTLDAEKAA
jgi:hypothetical protein